MALKQQYVTDAKTVMWKDCEKLVQKLHACLVEGNAMERNNKKDGLPVRSIILVERRRKFMKKKIEGLTRSL